MFGLYKITSSSGKRNLPDYGCPLNNLPDNIKKRDDFNLFSSRILKNWAQASLTELYFKLYIHTIIADTFPFNRFLRYFFYSIFLL